MNREMAELARKTGLVMFNPDGHAVRIVRLTEHLAIDSASVRYTFDMLTPGSDLQDAWDRGDR